MVGITDNMRMKDTNSSPVTSSRVCKAQTKPCFFAFWTEHPDNSSTKRGQHWNPFLCLTTNFPRVCFVLNWLRASEVFLPPPPCDTQVDTAHTYTPHKLNCPVASLLKCSVSHHGDRHERKFVTFLVSCMRNSSASLTITSSGICFTLVVRNLIAASRDDSSSELISSNKPFITSEKKRNPGSHLCFWCTGDSLMPKQQRDNQRRQSTWDAVHRGFYSMSSDQCAQANPDQFETLKQVYYASQGGRESKIQTSAPLIYCGRLIFNFTPKFNWQLPVNANLRPFNVPSVARTRDCKTYGTFGMPLEERHQGVVHYAELPCILATQQLH